MSAKTDKANGTERALAALGAACWRRPWPVVLSWILATIAAAMLIVELPPRLLSGSGDLAGSMSERVDRLVASEFTSGDGQSLLLVYRTPGGGSDGALSDRIEHRLVEHLGEQPHVNDITSADWLADADRTARSGGHRTLIVSLDSEDTLASEQLVEPLRAAVQSALGPMIRTDPGIEWAITGRAAISRDINVFSAKDTARSELRAVPFVLAVLFLAFGSLAAACLPLILAVAARTLALAAILAVAGFTEVSNLAQSIVTMISLALGIDYSLFIYHRYRELLPAGGSTSDGREAALRGAMAQSGRVVLYSGLAVAIGMGSLFATTSMQVRSIGLGGMLGVVMSMATALTLLPALLGVFHNKNRSRPRLMPTQRNSSTARWKSWGEAIVRRPGLAIALSLAVLSVLAAPATLTKFGFPEDDFLPPELESTRGLEMLEKAGLKGLVSPLFVVVSDIDRNKLVTPDRLAALVRLVDRLEADPRVGLVLAPPLTTNPRILPFPVNPNGGLLSATGDRALLRVIPSTSADLAGLRDLAKSTSEWRIDDRTRIDVGGQAQYYNDFDSEMRASHPVVLALVLFLTGLTLLVMLRAPLAAAKAIMLNLLSVAAGYGVVVFVFQLGYGAAVFGLAEPSQVVPPSVPIVIFAILFGLSMDYEIFLISRMRVQFLETGDNRRSIVEALSDTGAVISQAALIMALVFGAFAFSRLLIVQMIGLGLAVAVAVDAIIIRSTLGPALMTVAGKWNWWPMKSARLP